MSDENHAVILASGGMDSVTAVAVAQERGYELYMLHTSYGQRTETKEYECAKARVEYVDVTDFLHLTPDHLSKIGGSSLIDEELDVKEADLESDEIFTSYIPFRNANLLVMATSYAEANDCDAVFMGMHSEAFSGYPDCRPESFEAFQTVGGGTKEDTDISIKSPFVE